MSTAFFYIYIILRFEVRTIFFTDHHYFGIKLEKSEADPHIEDFFFFFFFFSLHLNLPTRVQELGTVSNW